MKRCVILAAAFLCLLSCRCPSSLETFVRTRDAEGGEYVFDLFMPDSLKSYDISFYVRTDPLLRKATETPIELSVDWVSPSDSVALSDTVYFIPDSVRGVERMYRTGVRLEKQGWKLKVRAGKAPRGLSGIGLVCKENGTR